VGGRFSAVVRAVDAYGNGVPGVLVTLGGTTPPPTPGGFPYPLAGHTLTSQQVATNASGNAIFSMVAQTSTGTYTLTASAPGLRGITSQPYTVLSLASPSVLTVIPAAGATVAGNGLGVTVLARDQYGNICDASGTATLTSSDGRLAPTTLTFSHGTASANVTLTKAGDVTLTATAGSWLTTAGQWVMGSSADVVVSPAPATHFAVTASVSSVYVGTPFNLTITALDPWDNTDTHYGGSASLTSSDGQAVSPASATLSNGSATVPVTLEALASAVTITALAGALSGTSPAIRVLPTPAITGLSTTEGYVPGYSSQYQQQGSSVTISGIGFLPGSKVQFGKASPAQTIDSSLETAPTYVDPSGTSLTVNVPRYAVNGPVYVVLPDNTVLTSPTSQSFTIHNYRNTYGFSFHNFTFNVTWGDVKGEFGGDQVDITISTPLGTIDTDVPSPAGLAFWGASAIAFNSKGACFGMALESRLLAANPGWISAANGLPSGQAPTVYNLQENGTLDDLIRQKHLAQWSAECAHEFFAWQGSNALGNISAQSVYNQVSSELAAGDNPIVCLEGGAGHTVVAYGLEPGPNGNGDYYIDVYDPNRPFNGPSNWSDLDPTESADGLSHRTIEQASRIYIDPAAQSWSFYMQGPNGTSYKCGGGWGSLEVYPVSSLSGRLTMPASLTGLGTVIFGAGEASAPAAAAKGSLLPTVAPAAPPCSGAVRPAPAQQAPAEAGSVRHAVDGWAVALARGGHGKRAGRPVWDSAGVGDLDLGHGDPFELLRRPR
jgi:hypothetical protein